MEFQYYLVVMHNPTNEVPQHAITWKPITIPYQTMLEGISGGLRLSSPDGYTALYKYVPGNIMETMCVFSPTVGEKTIHFTEHGLAQFLLELEGAIGGKEQENK